MPIPISPDHLRIQLMSSVATHIKPVASGVPLGHPLPPDTPYALTYFLPTWNDCVDARLDSKIVDPTLNIYPRYSDHISIRKVNLPSSMNYRLQFNDHHV